MNWFKRNIIILSFFLSIFIILITFVLYFKQFHSSFSDQNTYGQFGSYFGGVVGPILNFLALLILIITLKNQQYELKLIKNDSLKNNLFEVLKEVDKLLDDFKRPNDLKELNDIINNISVLISIKQMYRFLVQLEKIDKNSPILEYYIRKYLLLVDILNHNNIQNNKLPDVIEYFNRQIMKFNQIYNDNFYTE